MAVKIPVPAREFAEQAGMSARAIETTWPEYVTWMTKKFGAAAEFGGRSWQRFVGTYVERMGSKVAETVSLEREQADAAREKALADEAYKRGAVSYAAWLERLRDKAAWGDELQAEELTPRNAERRRRGLPVPYSHASGLAFLEALGKPLLPYMGQSRPMPTSGVHLVTHGPPPELSPEEVAELREAEREARERVQETEKLEGPDGWHPLAPPVEQ